MPLLLLELEEIERGEDEDEAEAEAGGIKEDNSSDVEPEEDEDTNVEGDNAKEKDQNRFEAAFSLSSNEDLICLIDDDQSSTEAAVKCRLPKRQRRPLETISITVSTPAEMSGTKELSEPVYADDNNGDGDEVISIEINYIMEDLQRTIIRVLKHSIIYIILYTTESPYATTAARLKTQIQDFSQYLSSILPSGHSTL
ncbi:hypothetical protein BC938DRAFT_480304, partial [Jimgerdemannia flammicorona]